MEIGKVPESVLKRSVLGQLKTGRKEVTMGAGLGKDCAILSFGLQEDILLASAPALAAVEDAVLYAIHTAVNHIAASGGAPVAVLLQLLLPPACEEAQLRAVMARAEEICAALHIQIAGGHTEVTDAVGRIVLTVTAAGKAERGSHGAAKAARPGADLVVTKWIGLEGTAMAAKGLERRLLKRFPSGLLEDAKGFDRYLSIIPEAASAGKSGFCAMTDASGGGIFGTLWEMAESSGVGLDIDIKKLPIRQETIEICNELDLNPYELHAGGSLLIAADNGSDLVRTLEKEGIPAAVVGKVTPGKDRLIHNGEEKRFLTPAGADGLYRLLAEEKERRD